MFGSNLDVQLIAARTENTHVMWKVFHNRYAESGICMPPSCHVASWWSVSSVGINAYRLIFTRIKKSFRFYKLSP